MEILRTIPDVLERLGGILRVSRLLTNALGTPYSFQTVYNWQKRDSFPDRKSYPVMLRALEALGFVPDPGLWGFSPRDFDIAVETARGIKLFYEGGDSAGLTGLSALVSLTAGGPTSRRASSRREPRRRIPNHTDRQMQLHV